MPVIAYIFYFFIMKKKRPGKNPTVITAGFVDQCAIKIQILLEEKLGKTRLWMVNSEISAYLKIMYKYPNTEQYKYYMYKGTIFSMLPRV